MYEFLKGFVLTELATLLTPTKDEPISEEIFRPREKYLKVSYCTTCMGRTHHLKKTLLKNIADNESYPDVEFVLVNYNSSDDMDQWVRSELSTLIEQEKVKYFRTDEPVSFHASCAKNLAHRLAEGDILVNLDADNFTGKDNAFYLNYLFQDVCEKAVYHFFKKDFRFYDTTGRIAVTSKDFYNVGGYREDLLPFSSQDLDFIKRLKLSGLEVKRVEVINFLRTVKHRSNLRMKNLNSSMNMKELRRKNKAMIREGLEKNIFKANPEGFVPYNVYKNFEATPISV